MARWRAGPLLAGCAAAALIAAGCAQQAPSAAPAEAPGTAPAAGAITGPIGHEGRWLTDSRGRVVLLHGVNMVAKGDQTPAQMGFGGDDAQWLAANGFDVVRLGLVAEAVMPTPGAIDTGYLRSFASTVGDLTRHGLLVLVDLHQDGWSSSIGSDGFPAWMTLTRGAVNTHTSFPGYYVTNPAIQAAFDSFWANDPGPGGVRLQARVGDLFEAIAAAVGGNPGVIGYDLINEPFPGSRWQGCVAGAGGCPLQDAASLGPYYARMDQAIRARDPRHLVFGEPWVLFNFGSSRTNIGLPGRDPSSGMSFHMYTTDPAYEPAVLSNAIAWSARTGGALLATEFGAGDSTAVVDRMVGELDSKLLPWIFWAFNGNVVSDVGMPPEGSNLVDSTVAALVRPHPVLVAGTPASLDYDTAGRVMRFTWTTRGPDGETFATGTPTMVKVPASVYPAGYRATVTGGQVTSRAGSADIEVVAAPGASEVSLTVEPAS